MDDEREFLQQIRERPHDEALRQVFADWLDEAGDERGEFFRLDARLAQMKSSDPERAELLRQWRDLRDSLPLEWQQLFSRSIVENCGLNLLPCPQKWNSLDATPDDGVRRCWACEKQVYYCRSIDELHAHAQQGHCVAIDPQIPYLPRDLVKVSEDDEAVSLGMIDRTDPPPSRLWNAARRRS